MAAVLFSPSSTTIHNIFGTWLNTWENLTSSTLCVNRLKVAVITKTNGMAFSSLLIPAETTSRHRISVKFSDIIRWRWVPISYAWLRAEPLFGVELSSWSCKSTNSWHQMSARVASWKKQSWYIAIMLDGCSRSYTFYIRGHIRRYIRQWVLRFNLPRAENFF